ncbi:UNKNOWN [Stylonychia lemnae]|uniref:Uncharacterized protein n=1 Tax=Stylonychia lemnae TaxID=5949 RepID=A0A078B1P5_STYLE|nr:UNKNOWN [Stylonychia lemnae]|eukprot:CDW88419.1 UNKNOWN [Stylonychia lemnae]
MQQCAFNTQDPKIGFETLKKKSFILRYKGQQIADKAYFLSIRAWLKLNNIFKDSPGPQVYIYRMQLIGELNQQYDLNPLIISCSFNLNHGQYQIMTNFSLQMKLCEFKRMVSSIMNMSACQTNIQFQSQCLEQNKDQCKMSQKLSELGFQNLNVVQVIEKLYQDELKCFEQDKNLIPQTRSEQNNEVQMIGCQFQRDQDQFNANISGTNGQNQESFQNRIDVNQFKEDSEMTQLPLDPQDYIQSGLFEVEKTNRNEYRAEVNNYYQENQQMDYQQDLNIDFRKYNPNLETSQIKRRNSLFNQCFDQQTPMELSYQQQFFQPQSWFQSFDEYKMQNKIQELEKQAQLRTDKLQEFISQQQKAHSIIQKGKLDPKSLKINLPYLRLGKINKNLAQLQQRMIDQNMITKIDHRYYKGNQTQIEVQNHCEFKIQKLNCRDYQKDQGFKNNGQLSLPNDFKFNSSKQEGYQQQNNQWQRKRNFQQMNTDCSYNSSDQNIISTSFISLSDQASNKRRCLNDRSITKSNVEQ